MAHISLWLGAAAVMLCSIPASSLGSVVLLCVHSQDNEEILCLLGQLKSIPTQSCLNDRNDFKFPWDTEATAQMSKAQLTCFSHRMLQQTLNLFETECSQAAWNRTLLEQLLSRLDHSLQRLEQTEDQNLACPYLEMLVRRYFRRIHDYLERKKYSPCAWDIVRTEIMRSLSLSAGKLEES